VTSPLRWLSVWATFLATIQAGMAVLGLARVPLSQPVALALGALAVAAAVAVLRLLPRARSPRPSLSRGRWLVVPLLAVAAVLYGGSLVAAWYKPDFSWDGGAYHSPMIATWAQTGYVRWVPPDGVIGERWEGYLSTQCNGFTRGAELMGFFLVRVLGTSRAINTFNVWFLPLGALGIAHLARLLGASRTVALFVATSFLLVPVNVTQSMTTYVDTAYACSAVAWLAAVASGCVAFARGTLSWRLFPALGASLGLMIATKAAGPLLAVLGVAALLASALLARVRGRQAPRAFAVMSAVVAAGLAIGGQFYLRNWIHEGNPFHPVRVTLLGFTVFPGVPTSEILAEAGNLPDSMRSLGAAGRVLLAWTQGGYDRWPQSIRYYDAREGGLGYLWALGCFPAICALLVGTLRRTGKRSQRGVFAVLTAVTVAAFLATPMNWWARYTLWIYGLGLPCLAACASAWLRRRAFWPRAATLTLLCVHAALVVFEAGFAFTWSATPAAFVGPPRIPGSLAEIPFVLTDYRPTSFFFPGLDGPIAAEAFTSDATVAVAPLDVPALPALGQLAMPIGFRHVLLADPGIGHDEAALRAFRERTGAAYVIWSLSLGRPEVLERMRLRVERLHPLWDLYELVPPDPGRRHAKAK
jgi:hypothetical protein